MEDFYTAILRPISRRASHRVEYPGAIYHVMSRGDRKKDIYLDDVDRQDFLKTLAEACQKTGFEVHAYCLMRNHLPMPGTADRFSPGGGDT
jgi:REP element-mobilizing transposase RayT